jgi:hypothetical protein
MRNQKINAETQKQRIDDIVLNHLLIYFPFIFRFSLAPLRLFF